MTDTLNTTQGKGAVDWSRPIEAVHEDGQVAAALLVDVDNPKVDDSPYYVAFDRVKLWARSDGSMMATSWRIRNVPEHPTPTQYAPELVASMEAFVRRCAGGFYLMGVNEDGVSAYEVVRDAKSILSDLPQEVDPKPNVEVQEARDLAAALCSTLKLDGLAQGYRDGRYDGDADELRNVILNLGMPR